MSNNLKPKFEFAGSYGYDKDEVDDLIAEKDKEIARLKAALSNCSNPDAALKYLDATGWRNRCYELEQALKAEKELSTSFSKSYKAVSDTLEKNRVAWARERQILTNEIRKWKTARDGCENQFQDKVEEVGEWIEKYNVEHKKLLDAQLHLEHTKKCLEELKKTVTEFLINTNACF